MTGMSPIMLRILVAAFTGEKSRAQLQAVMGLRDRNHFTSAYLRPALDAGMIEMALPGKATSRNQRYRLTAAGKDLAQQVKPIGQGAEHAAEQDTPQDRGHVTDRVEQLVAALAGEMSRAHLQELIGLRDRNHFTSAYLRPALEAGMIEMAQPAKATSRNQRYRRTAAGGASGEADQAEGLLRMNTAPIVSRVWSFCTTLRDDGVSYGDYLEQLTYLIFLKMADEYGKPPYSRDVGIPAAYDWQSLKTKRGAELEAHYVTLLRELGTRRGMLGQIFTKAQNKIQDPAKLYRLIDMVDDTDWVTLGADVKGDIYEGLLEKNAEDTKSGAGQYFTPRALIRAMVECMRPEPRKRIADPACGNRRVLSGFLRLHHRRWQLHARP